MTRKEFAILLGGGLAALIGYKAIQPPKTQSPIGSKEITAKEWEEIENNLLEMYPDDPDTREQVKQEMLHMTREQISEVREMRRRFPPHR